MNWIFWSMGDVCLQGMGHLLGCPQLSSKCYPCPWTQLLPMSPDCTNKRANPYEVSSCQETNDPSERFFSFFSAYRAWRSLPSVACADSISGCRCQPRVAAPHTDCGAVATVVAIAANRGGSPLRPRNEAVPS